MGVGRLGDAGQKQARKILVGAASTATWSGLAAAAGLLGDSRGARSDRKSQCRLDDDADVSQSCCSFPHPAGKHCYSSGTLIKIHHPPSPRCQRGSSSLCILDLPHHIVHSTLTAGYFRSAHPGPPSSQHTHLASDDRPPLARANGSYGMPLHVAEPGHPASASDHGLTAKL